MKKIASFGAALAIAACMQAQVQNKVILEEFTGAWCGYCVDGHVIAENIVDTYPGRVVLVSVHNGDGMVISQCDTLEGYASVSGFPSGMVNRKSFGTIELNRGQWSAKVASELGDAPVQINILNDFNATSRVLTVDIEADFVDFSNGTHKLIAFLTRDIVTGTGSGFNQANYYNTTSGHPMFGMGNPIVGYQHEKVLSAYLTPALGTTAVIPGNQIPGDLRTVTYTYNVPVSWDINNLNVVVAIQRSSIFENEIIQVQEVDANSSVTGLDTRISSETIGVYPNPASGNDAVVSFALSSVSNVSVELFTLQGQLISAEVIGQLGIGEHQHILNAGELPSGMYIVKLKADDRVLTTKLSVQQ